MNPPNMTYDSSMSMTQQDLINHIKEGDFSIQDAATWCGVTKRTIQYWVYDEDKHVMHPRFGVLINLGMKTAK